MTWYGEDPKMNVADVNKVTWWYSLLLRFPYTFTHLCHSCVHAFVCPSLLPRPSLQCSSLPRPSHSYTHSFMYSFIHARTATIFPVRNHRCRRPANSRPPPAPETRCGGLALQPPHFAPAFPVSPPLALPPHFAQLSPSSCSHSNPGIDSLQQWGGAPACRTPPYPPPAAARPHKALHSRAGNKQIFCQVKATRALASGSLRSFCYVFVVLCLIYLLVQCEIELESK